MSLVKITGKTLISGKTIFSTGYRAKDSSALAYITAVEAADNNILENNIKEAIDSFVTGCKSDGIWNAIKSCCILAGARTLNGALIPLVGPSPTNFNFVSQDYDRETGLIGDGVSKYISTNFNNNTNPQNDNHMTVYVTEYSANESILISGGSQTEMLKSSIGKLRTYNRTSILGDSTATIATGFAGMSRSTSGSYELRNASSNKTINNSSAVAQNNSVLLYKRPGTTSFSNDGRISFYSVGESLNLALFDSRVTALMTAIQTTI